MKFISLILALMVVVLSTTPCFAEDKCLEQTFETSNNQHQNDNDCNKSCCSPFFNCNTCTGFVLTNFHFSIEHSVKEPQRKLGTMPTPPISDFPYSIWHPPQLA